MVSDAQKWFLGVQTWFLSHLTWFLALRNGFWVCRHGFWLANMKNVCWISGWGYSWGMKTTKFSLDRGVLLMLGLGAAAIGLVWVLFLRGPGPQTAVRLQIRQQQHPNHLFGLIDGWFGTDTR